MLRTLVVIPISANTGYAMPYKTRSTVFAVFSLIKFSGFRQGMKGGGAFVQACEAGKPVTVQFSWVLLPIVFVPSVV